MKALARASLLFALAMAGHLGVRAATQVSGSLSANTTWNLAGSPYLVVQNVTVPSGITLTVEPGVAVRFCKGSTSAPAERYSLLVAGTLVARGTSASPIVFTSAADAPQAGDWGGLQFAETAVGATCDAYGEYAGGCIVEHATVEYGGAANGAMIYALDGAPYLNQVVIRQSVSSGFMNNRYSSPGPAAFTIRGCAFSANAFLDVSVGNQNLKLFDCDFSSRVLVQSFDRVTSLHVSGCRFTGCNSGYALDAVYLLALVLENTDFIDNAGCCQITDCQTVSVQGCRFEGNSSYALQLSSNYFNDASATVQSCLFIGNGFNTISCEGDSGMGLTMRDSLVTGGGGEYAVQLDSGRIERCSIVNNLTDAGLVVKSRYVPSEYVVSGSNLFGHAQYDLYNDSFSPVTATGNYWGSGDAYRIMGHIFDFFDDNGKGEVDFGSFLNQAAPDAPAPVVMVAGVIRDNSGLGREGVTVTFSNGGGTAVTGANGAYRVAVPQGWSGTATPTQAGCLFSPASRTYANLQGSVKGQDYSTIGQGAKPVISGRVTQANGTPLYPVLLTFSNGGGTTTTVYDGAYQQEVPVGWSGSVTASRTGYSFTPGLRTYSNVTASMVGQDFTVPSDTIAVSGRVQKPGGTPVAGVLVSLAGLGTVTTDSGGYYRCVIPSGWSGAVRPVKKSYVFTPSERTCSASSLATLSGQNFTATLVSEVYGDIAANTVWRAANSPYVLSQNVRVLPGVTLAIEPGVTVKFTKGAVAQPRMQRPDERYRLVVEGTLVARGTVDAPIRFTSAESRPQPGDWGGLLFTPTAVGAVYDANGQYVRGSIIEYAAVEYGGNSITETGMIHVQDAAAANTAPYLNQVFIHASAYFGLNNDGAVDSPRVWHIRNCHFSENGNDGLSVSNAILNVSGCQFEDSLVVGGRIEGTKLFVGDCLFTYNGNYRNGISTSWEIASLEVRNSIFQGAMHGCISSSSQTALFDGCRFIDNGSALALGKAETATVKNCTFIGNGVTRSFSVSAIDCLSSSFLMQDCLVTGNSGTNAVGIASGRIERCSIVNNDTDCGVRIYTYDHETAPTYSISESNLFGHRQYDVVNETNSTVTATGNYWGTADPSIVMSRIYDQSDDASLGAVLFQPLLGAIATGAPVPVAAVSGRIAVDEDTPVAGATVTFSNGGGSVVTNARGFYVQSLPLGWTGTVTPSRTGYTFTPASHDYTDLNSCQAGQDFTGAAIPYVISGRVALAEGTGVGNVALARSDAGSVKTGSDGRYSVTVPAGWTGTLTPVLAGWTFTPADRGFADVQADQADQDFLAVPIVYTVSGRVTVDGAGRGGIVMSGLPGNPVTDAGGNYQATVPYGWSGTVTPTAAGYVFTPSSRVYAGVKATHGLQDFTAVAPVVLVRDYDWAKPNAPDFNGDGKAELAARTAGTGYWWVGTLTGGKLVTANWGRWSPATAWTKVLRGDFNGDGKTDIAARVVSSGDWYVGLSTGTAFVTAKWGKWSPATAWSYVLTGDFNGDGKTDVAGRDMVTGDWYVAVSTGTSFTTAKWGRWSAGMFWPQVLAGDYNGDGVTDLAGRAAATGDWWVSLSTGSAFATARWGNWAPATDWLDLQAGDFNADGLADIAGRAADTGYWTVLLSNGGSFGASSWGRWSPAVAWQNVLAGDFNGDGRTDAAGWTPATGDWYVGLAKTAGGFATTSFGKWSTGIAWLDVLTGDLNGDGRSDLAGRTSNTGVWWFSLSNGSAFTTQSVGKWSPATDWQMVGEEPAAMPPASAAAPVPQEGDASSGE